MSSNNILVPIKLPNTVVTLTDTAVFLLGYLKTNYSDWYDNHKKTLERLNSIKLYIKEGDISILYDGNICDADNAIILEEGLHVIENINLSTINLLGPGKVIIQIGIIS